MDDRQSVFIIIDSIDCPVYRIGDEFRLIERALRLPDNKPACLTLMSDIAEALKIWEDLKQCRLDPGDGHLFNCKGHLADCHGSIRLAHRNEQQHRNLNTLPQIDREIDGIVNVLRSFSIFKNLTPFELREIVSYFRIKHYPAHYVIIKKGDPGLKLFIILAGKVEVLGEHEVNIAYLSRGEVFGEMSLLSGEQIGTTIRSLEPLKLLYLYGDYFRKVLQRFPSVQMYFTRLLAKRLSISNLKLEREFSPGIVGYLTEISPSELLQTLNMNSKTGVVTLTLPDSVARVCLKEGKLIHAEFENKMGIEAFFMILKQKDGRFQFSPGLSEEELAAEELGDFMHLLMEGLNRIDEGNI